MEVNGRWADHGPHGKKFQIALAVWRYGFEQFGLRNDKRTPEWWAATPAPFDPVDTVLRVPKNWNWITL